MKKVKRVYGWRPDKPDIRDHRFEYSASTPSALSLPSLVDLRPHCPPVLDQGQLGSCTANAIAGAIDFARMKEGLEPWTPSRLFIYYNERAIEGTVKEDAGAEIRDGLKSVNKQGACRETLWPYVIKKFAQKPPKKAYTSALAHKALTYKRLDTSGADTLLNAKACLAAGYPFPFGFTVYESFESEETANTGIVNLPAPGEGVLGGHAVLGVGFDDSTRRILCQNSWGTSWGLSGFFWLPYGYVQSTDLSADYWQITLVK